MIGSYYTEEVILLDKSTSTGGYWSTSTGDAYTTAVSIDAAVNLLSAPEQFEYSRMGYDATYKVFAEVSTEIYAGRRCRWNGEEFQIVDVPKNTLQKGHHMRFLIGEVGNA